MTVILPTDFVCGDTFANDAKLEECSADKGVSDGYMGLEIGPELRKVVVVVAVMRAKTVIFNFCADTKAAGSNNCITLMDE